MIKERRDQLYKYYPDDWIIDDVDNLLMRVRNKVNVDRGSIYQEVGIKSHCRGLFHKPMINGEDLGNKNVFWLDKDCFIVNIVFAWEHAIAMTTENEVGLIASHRFPMWKGKEGVDTRYIYHFFKSHIGKHLLQLASPGGAGRNKTLGQGEFGATRICIPNSIEEQKEIVSILENFEKIISLKERLIEEKKKFRDGSIHLLINANKSKDDNQKWKRVFLNEICDLKVGKTPSRNNPKYWGGSEKWISIADMKKKFITDTKECITDSAVYETNIKCIPKDTVIMSFKLSIGKLTITTEDMYSNEAIVALHIKDEDVVDNQFMYYSLLSKDIRRFGSRAAKGITLNQDSLKEVFIEVPKIEEQKKIVKVLSLLDEEIELIEREYEMIVECYKNTSRSLLSGNLRVMNKSPLKFLGGGNIECE